MRRSIAALTVFVMVAALFGAFVRPAAAQISGSTYTVQPGDNLYRIGLKFGLSVDVLAKANGIVNANYVTVGQKLIIPGLAPAPSATSAVATAAATMSGTESGTEATLLPTLTLTPNSTVDTGIVMTPAATSAAETTTSATLIPTLTPIASATETPAPTPTTYTVQVGDNLYRISLKFHTSMLVLMQLNNISNANVVYVGQVLALPNVTPVVALSPTATAALVAQGATLVPGATQEATTTNTASNVGFSYGVVVDMTGQDAAKLTASVKDLGMTWVRLPVSWHNLEVTKGNIDATTLDAQIDALNGAGVKILLTVSSAPDWARPTTAESGPPTDFTDYANFVGALAARYKGRVQAYEIWNEPNIRREWNGRPLSAASYVELLRLAQVAIKRGDSSALVISAGLSPTGFNDGVNAINDRVFLRQAFAAGLASYADAVGIHPGGWANPPDSSCCLASPGVTGWFNDRSFYFRDTIKDYRDIMVQNGAGSTYLWVTEFGWGSSDGVVSDPNTVDPNFGFVKLTNQTQQAQYLPRAYEVAKTLVYVGPMFAYNLDYCLIVSQPTSSEFRGCYYSLLDAGGNPRPVYNALKAVAK